MLSKKTFLIGVATLFFFFTKDINAQNFKGGFTAGFSAAQIHGDKLSGYNRPTIKLGIFSELKRKRRKKGTGGLELNFQGKGSNTSLNTPIEQEKKVRLYYLDFVPYYRYKIKKNIYFKTGIAVAYLLKKDLKIAGTEFDIDNDKFNKVSFDGLIGLSTSISKNVFAQVEWQASLLPFTKKQVESSLFYPKGLQHRIITFSIYSLF